MKLGFKNKEREIDKERERERKKMREKERQIIKNVIC